MCVELEPNIDRSEFTSNSPNQGISNSVQDAEFDFGEDIQDLKRARQFVLGVRGEYWNLKKYKINRGIANILAEQTVADVIYAIRPTTGDMSEEANNHRRAIRLLVEASNSLIKTGVLYSRRREDTYYRQMTNIIAGERETPSNIILFRSKASKVK